MDTKPPTEASTDSPAMATVDTCGTSPTNGTQYPIEGRPLPEALLKALEEHSVGVKAAITLRVIERIASQLYLHMSQTNNEAVPQKPRIASLASEVIREINHLVSQCPSANSVAVLVKATEDCGMAYVWGTTGTFAKGEPGYHDIYLTLSYVLRLLRCQYTKRGTSVMISPSDLQREVVRAIDQCAEHYQEAVKNENTEFERLMLALASTMVFEAMARVPPESLLRDALASSRKPYLTKGCLGRNDAIANLLNGFGADTSAKRVADMIDANLDSLETHGGEIEQTVSAVRHFAPEFQAAMNNGDIPGAKSIEQAARGQICRDAKWVPGPLSLRDALQMWTVDGVEREPSIRALLRSLGIRTHETVLKAALKPPHGEVSGDLRDLEMPQK